MEFLLAYNFEMASVM